MRKALYVIILLGAILDPYNAKSQQWSAGGSVPISVRDFVLACSKEGGVWLTFCLAYIQGVSSYAHGLSDSGYTQLFYPGFGQLLCHPKNLSNQQIAKIFILWANENPEHWKLSGAKGVAAALGQAWPCGDQ